MRLALDAAGETGSRAGRVLLAERDVPVVGLVDQTPSDASEPRLRHVDDLADWDVLIVDEVRAPRRLITRAVDHGVHLVTPWHDDLYNEAIKREPELAAAGLTVLVGADTRTGLLGALLAMLEEDAPDVLELVAAWTVEGHPRRRGEALPFPGPVGPLWGKPADAGPRLPYAGLRSLVAPVDGRWVGLLARCTSVSETGVTVRTLGVADDLEYLKAMTLAAGALIAGSGVLSSGVRRPAEAHRLFLERAYAAGLAVASFTETRSAVPER